MDIYTVDQYFLAGYRTVLRQCEAELVCGNKEINPETRTVTEQAELLTGNERNK